MTSTIVKDYTSVQTMTATATETQTATATATQTVMETNLSNCLSDVRIFIY
jgi:hypothetical protein